jgi:hypothetical protein
MAARVASVSSFGTIAGPCDGVPRPRYPLVLFRTHVGGKTFGRRLIAAGNQQLAVLAKELSEQPLAFEALTNSNDHQTTW